VKINKTGRLGGTGAVSPSARKTVERGGEVAPRTISDATSILGIPEHELTDKVRAAIMKLMAEVDRLRQEMEQTKKRISYLENLADQDTLVPVANRRAFVRELTRMISFSERYDAPSSLLFFDIDAMKEINDRFGHAAGDAALIHIVDLLVNKVRSSDLVGRLGGDEFGVILAQADQATANEKARLLVEAIENLPFSWQGYPIRLNVTVGAYTFRGGDNAGEALAAADRAMYKQKQTKNADL
jgi:diguanylate cyclase (GGDEF)-like protein